MSVNFAENLSSAQIGQLTGILYPEPIHRSKIERHLMSRIKLKDIRPRRVAVVLELRPNTQPAGLKSTAVRRASRFADPKFAFSYDELIGPRRGRALIRARHRFCWYLRIFYDFSFPRIALIVGGRDHATIMHAVKKMNRTYGLPEDYRTPVGSPSVMGALLAARKASAAASAGAGGVTL